MRGYSTYQPLLLATGRASMPATTKHMLIRMARMKCIALDVADKKYDLYCVYENLVTNAL